MDGESYFDIAALNSITCTNVPKRLFDDEAAVKAHFGQFGRFKTISLHPRRKRCVVEYHSAEAAQLAHANAGVGHQMTFNVAWTKKFENKRDTSAPPVSFGALLPPLNVANIFEANRVRAGAARARSGQRDKPPVSRATKRAPAHRASGSDTAGPSNKKRDISGRTRSNSYLIGSLRNII